MKSELPTRLPAHIAFIMDGNGRWAKKRLLPRIYGHKVGVETMRNVAVDVFDAGIPYMSVYAFSTENRLRPKEEVDGLCDLIRTRLEPLTADMIERGIRILFTGGLDYFPADVQEVIERVATRSNDCDRGTLNIALNYGGRDEIVRAAARVAASGQPVTAETFAAELYTAGLPDPDLVVRTGGEQRLSNFMLYQTAYAELFFVDTLWPDFGKDELYAVLAAYAKRDRRYGKV